MAPVAARVDKAEPTAELAADEPAPHADSSVFGGGLVVELSDAPEWRGEMEIWDGEMGREGGSIFRTARVSPRLCHGTELWTTFVFEELVGY